MPSSNERFSSNTGADDIKRYEQKIAAYLSALYDIPQAELRATLDELENISDSDSDEEKPVKVGPLQFNGITEMLALLGPDETERLMKIFGQEGQKNDDQQKFLRDIGALYKARIEGVRPEEMVTETDLDQILLSTLINQRTINLVEGARDSIIKAINALKEEGEAGVKMNPLAKTLESISRICELSMRRVSHLGVRVTEVKQHVAASNYLPDEREELLSEARAVLTPYMGDQYKTLVRYLYELMNSLNRAQGYSHETAGKLRSAESSVDFGQTVQDFRRTTESLYADLTTIEEELRLTNLKLQATLRFIPGECLEAAEQRTKVSIPDPTDYSLVA